MWKEANESATTNGALPRLMKNLGTVMKVQGTKSSISKKGAHKSLKVARILLLVGSSSPYHMPPVDRYTGFTEFIKIAIFLFVKRRI
jgi:hypothetical protein